MQALRVLDHPATDTSPLTAARMHRRLSVDEAARRADLTLDELTWLEEGRLYRFPSSHAALAAVLTYATALGIDRREALELAGRGGPPRSETTRARLAGIGALAVLVAVLAAALLAPRFAGGSAADTAADAPLPPPWRISVDVLNGGGDVNYTRNVADRIASSAYQVRKVRPADRFDYPETAVYYPPGAERLADRLADELCVTAKPLPGGENRRRLVVVVGPPRGPDYGATC